MKLSKDTMTRNERFSGRGGQRIILSPCLLCSVLFILRHEHQLVSQFYPSEHDSRPEQSRNTTNTTIAISQEGSRDSETKIVHTTKSTILIYRGYNNCNSIVPFNTSPSFAERFDSFLLILYSTTLHSGPERTLSFCHSSE